MLVIPVQHPIPAVTEHGQPSISDSLALYFDGCDAIFDGPTVSWDDDRVAYGEQRINLIGWLHGTVVHMTYTERGDEPHIISLRKAEKHEIRRYVKEISR